MAGPQDPWGRNQEPTLYYVFFSSTALSEFSGRPSSTYSFLKVPASVAARLQEIDGEIIRIEGQLPNGRYEGRPDLARRNQALVAEWNRLVYDSGYTQLRTNSRLEGTPFNPGQVFTMDEIRARAPNITLSQIEGQRRETRR